MNTSLTLKTRREFLRTTILGGAITWTVPSFVASTFDSLNAAAADSAGQIATGKDAPILVVMQLGGGNDGLNTVVPYTNDFYYKARPVLGIKPNQVLKINDECGLNPSLAGFKQLFDQGHVSIIQGAGYPNPIRSHFRSTDIWQTASDADKIEHYGWIGRYFDNNCAGADPTIGVNVGKVMPPVFLSEHTRTVSLQNPEKYRFLSNDPSKKIDQSFRKLNQMAGDAPMDDVSLDFLQRTSLDAQASSDKILGILGKMKSAVAYPDSELASDLRMIAGLIAAGLPTRVYYTQQGEYDTHQRQGDTHPKLLKEFSEGMRAFCDDLKKQGNFDRVLILVFSEFGRRVQENASGGGTDHGAAAPMFVISGSKRLKSGMLSKQPSLDPKDLFQGDLVHNVDFRTIYAAVLEKWLKTPSAPVLFGKTWQPFDLLA